MSTEHEQIHQPVNLGNPSEFTMNELALQIAEITGKEIRIKHLPLPQDDPRRRQPDITKAKTLLNWSPKVALSDGLARTSAYFVGRINPSKQHK